ncbi:flagellar biosynthesis anti-sigma factor FlgM [Sporolactobacillus vineae]|uniref:flagellar biosynthesis anti-sigma factor FlgM n=1 Tax=Sporolactobacillus vineae TaxID=444463 RepID=UPI000288CEBD|nr:flagellar biosynthesis anti-sigma factor FlgM [Sporolactobacillus vineae]
MKIDGYQPIQPYAGYPASKPAETKPGAAPVKSDQVEISPEARRMQDVQKFSQARKARVADLKAQVDAGTYHVAAEDIAKKMYAYWNKF